jgi:L-erythro-3,5-diaminohexanoate dehydrogenase
MSTQLRPVVGSGDVFGIHRSLEPAGALPQPAQRVSADFTEVHDGELLLAVETLNVDAASFRQMEEAAAATGVADDGIANAVGERVVETVKARGKQHNPVTGSGGMLLGRVLQVTPAHPFFGKLRDGDRVATLVSLSLTPLRIDAVKAVRRESTQLDVEGEAVLFASGAFAVLDGTLSDRLALAILDVAGAAPQVARLVKPAHVVVVLGAGGKSGILCVAEARRQGGPEAIIVGVENHEPAAKELRELGLCTAVISGNARDAVAMRQAVLEATGGREADVTFSCVNVDGAEMAAILCTRNRGTVYFFAMSTSFTRAALGAEGVGRDVDLLIGNGYAENHADHTLDLVKGSPKVLALFAKRYG